MPLYTPDYMGYPPGSAPSSGLASASMVCGIVSLMLVCAWIIAIPSAIVAITLGLVAKGQIKAARAAVRAWRPPGSPAAVLR